MNIFFQAKEGDKGSKRSATDEGPLRTPWELARDREMSNHVENHNVCQMHSRLFYMIYLSKPVWKFWLIHFAFKVHICLLMNQCFLLQKRHRGESLMDMHSKKLEKQKVKNWFTYFYLIEPRGIGKFRCSLSFSVGVFNSLFSRVSGPGFSKDG